MAYIDKAYYDLYTTTAIDAATFAVLAERASTVIDALTMGRITAEGFDNLAAATQAMIKKAVAAQVETLYLQGGIDALNGNADNSVDSMSAGSVSISSGSKLRTMGGIPISPMVGVYLLHTGLLYRGLSRC